jgi:hypothetical protein
MYIKIELSNAGGWLHLSCSGLCLEISSGPLFVTCSVLTKRM